MAPSTAATPKYTAAANMAVVAAGLFFWSAIFQIVATNVEHGNDWNDPNVFLHPYGGKPHPAWNATERHAHYLERLDTHMHGDSLARRWENRRNSRVPYFLGIVPAIMAWFAALPAVEVLTTILGDTGRSSASYVRYAVLTAAFLTIVEFTSEAGTATMTDWITTWPLVQASANETTCAPDDGEPGECFGPLQSLEMSYLVTHSRTLWLYAMDRLLLCAATLLTAFLTYTSTLQHLTNHFAHLSVVVGIFCFSGFWIEVSRFISWRTAAAGLVFSHVAIDMLLVPAWLVALAIQLRKVSNRSNRFDMQMSWERAQVAQADKRPAAPEQEMAQMSSEAEPSAKFPALDMSV